MRAPVNLSSCLHGAEKQRLRFDQTALLRAHVPMRFSATGKIRLTSQDARELLLGFRQVDCRG